MVLNAGVSVEAMVSHAASLCYDPKERVEARYAYARERGGSIPGSASAMLAPTDEVWTRRLGLDHQHYLQWRRDNGYSEPRTRKPKQQ